MRTVLYDMQIAEGLVETQSEFFLTGDAGQDVYDAVFSKHNITQAQYDSSLIWYGKNMDLYMSIYKLVLQDINKSIDILGDIKPDPLSGDISAKDSVDIWIYNRSYAFKPERVFNTLTFDIAPNIPYSSGSSYVLGMLVRGIPPDLKHNPKIHISAVHDDTIISVNKEITGDGYYEAIVRTIVTKQVKQVYGYVMINNAEATYHRIYLDGINMMKYNYGSKALTAPQDPSEMKSEE